MTSPLRWQIPLEHIFFFLQTMLLGHCQAMPHCSHFHEESEVKCFAQVCEVGKQLIQDNQLDLLTPGTGLALMSCDAFHKWRGLRAP